MPDMACENLETSFICIAKKTESSVQALWGGSDKTNRDQIVLPRNQPHNDVCYIWSPRWQIWFYSAQVLPWAHKTKASGNNNLHGSSPDSPFQVKNQGSEFITPASSTDIAVDNEGRGQSSPSFSAQVVGSWTLLYISTISWSLSWSSHTFSIQRVDVHWLAHTERVVEETFVSNLQVIVSCILEAVMSYLHSRAIYSVLLGGSLAGCLVETEPKHVLGDWVRVILQTEFLQEVPVSRLSDIRAFL